MAGIITKSSPYVLGIDLGTTNSSVSVYLKGKNTTINIEGAASIPSVVLFEDRKLDEVIVGSVAKKYKILKPNCVFSSIKSFMRNDDWKHDPEILNKHTFDDEVLSPTHIAAEILKKIKYEVQQNTLFSEAGNFDKVCITVPANSSPIYKNNIYYAAELAGFGERDDSGNLIKDESGHIQGIVILDEPTAAALVYGQTNDFFNEDVDKEQNILVYDFGGGTFDVTILNITTESGVSMPRFKVVGTKGVAKLGGDDLDKAIMRLAAQEILENTGIDIFDLARDQKATSRKELLNAQSKLKEEAEQVKIAFASGSNKMAIKITSLFKDGDGKVHNLDMVILKTDFIAAIDEYLAQTITCVDEALQEANMSIDDINRIVMVGGSCKGPWVKECITKKYDKEPYNAQNVDTIVSQGAAYFGSVTVNSNVCPNCHNETSLAISVVNPCPHCGFAGDANCVELGSMTTHTYGIEIKGGFFAPMIEKGLVFDDDNMSFSYTRCFGNAENSSSVIITGFITQAHLDVVEDHGLKRCVKSMNVHQLKGEERLFECIGEFELRGIPKAAAGTISIEVTMKVDKDNTIRVSANTLDGEVKEVVWKN